MAGLADDWPDHRQMCVDVLCAYLRMPYEPEPGDDAPVEKRLVFQYTTSSSSLQKKLGVA